MWMNFETRGASDLDLGLKFDIVMEVLALECEAKKGSNHETMEITEYMLTPCHTPA